MADFSIREAMRRKPHPVQYAVLRMPTKTGEFVAHWPEDATADDLRTMHRFFGACMDGWIASAELWERSKASDAAAEAEYASWFVAAGSGEE